MKRAAALLACSAALLSPACGGSRMGQAAVRLESGQPCFGLADAEARGKDLRLAAITIFDVSDQPERVWTLLAGVPALEAAQTLPLPPGRCVKLDDRPAGYSVTALAALREGRVYEVAVNAQWPDGRRDAQAYRLRFCLGSGARVQALPPNAGRCEAR